MELQESHEPLNVHILGLGVQKLSNKLISVGNGPASSEEKFTF